MPKVRTAEESRTYKRLYRARRAAQTAVAGADSPVRPSVEPVVRPPIRRFVTGETVEHAMARPRVVVDPKFPSGFHYLPGDRAIGRMMQGARDAILTRP